MQAVTAWIGSVLGSVLNVCYSICGNFGLAIILFTLVSKIILLPLGIWVHRNGLKMVRILPDINWLKVNHYGDKDAIAEGQAALPFDAAVHGLLEYVLHPGERGDGFVQRAAQREEEFEDRVEQDLDNLVSDCQGSYAKVVLDGSVVGLHAENEEIVFIAVDADDFIDYRNAGILCISTKGDQQDGHQ